MLRGFERIAGGGADPCRASRGASKASKQSDMLPYESWSRCSHSVVESIGVKQCYQSGSKIKGAHVSEEDLLRTTLPVDVSNSSHN